MTILLHNFKIFYHSNLTCEVHFDLEALRERKGCYCCDVTGCPRSKPVTGTINHSSMHSDLHLNRAVICSLLTWIYAQMCLSCVVEVILLLPYSSPKVWARSELPWQLLWKSPTTQKTFLFCSGPLVQQPRSAALQELNGEQE